ncbi:MAG: T9SS type A sorting domain-containing protein [Bacteroidota bacterium]|nr:T9SS type A sorting domain-containing protein [Bacteroidota bacterium]
MKKNRIHLIISAALAFSLNAGAKENVGNGAGIAPLTNTLKSVMAGCNPATAKSDLDINNVRTTILAGGDMWWDLVNGRYFVPKPAAGSTGPTSLYAGSLWIGGLDIGGSLKVAAMTYRQTGNDFWPGPLDNTASIDAAVCTQWDKHFRINRADAEAYYNWADGGFIGNNPVGSEGMNAINNWPTTGIGFNSLAPFWDINGDGFYQPENGEIPDFDVTGTRGCDAELFGDQALFWVFNDKGNVHTETGGTAIGLEIQAQAFAFATNDEINNMTFYRYKIINRSSFRLDSTYFGCWVDPDLGSANDDYVGCDVELGLGFCYNGDEVDDNPPSGQIPYGSNPPAIGVDFFEGPFADSNGLDDSDNGIPPSFLYYNNDSVDDERIGMAKFVYYNNDASVTGNPDGAVDIYRYLKGIWRDNTPMTYGGTGHLTGTACDYMFPGSSDLTDFYGTNGIPVSSWSEELVGNVPADRRFIQSAGSFTLKPGAINTITTGVVWARANSGGNLASVALMKGADAKAQKLFDNCFLTLDGPTAPNLAIQELNQELILTWTNPQSGTNNPNESYTEDPNRAIATDSLYRFQGYIVYQLRDNTVSTTDLYNVDKARIVFQCDIKDGKSQLINFYKDLNLNALVPVEMVKGADNGIVHSISLTEDKFATGNNRLVNHKTYYFAIIAYGYSKSEEQVDYTRPIDYLPFISGRKQADGYFVHTAIPHIPSPEAGGTDQHSTYGSGPQLIRIEGHGNGGNVLDLTDQTTADILANNRVITPQYINGRGPVNIKVVDPLNVPEGDFRFKLLGVSDTARWQLTNLTTGEVVNSEKTIKIPNEQIINGQLSSPGVVIPKWGLSVNVVPGVDPGNAAANNNNGFLEASMSFSDVTKQWLTGLPDQEGAFDLNWIRSGGATFTAPEDVFNDYSGIDDQQAYEKVLGGTWAPYRLCAFTPTSGSTETSGGPAWGNLITLSQMKNLASIDVVFTSDQSKWTRCPVIELAEESTLAIGGAKKMSMRKQASVDKGGNANYPSGDNNDFATGMSWFPGYAINLETGERLNMAFGEDSYLLNENGRDMKWNPSSGFITPEGVPLFGGKHYIYIFGHNGDAVYTSADAYLPNALRDIPRYDAGKAMHDLLYAAEITSSGVSDAYKREVWADAMWVNIPIQVPGHSLLESDVKVRLRVSKEYRKNYTTNTISPVLDASTAPVNNNFPTYDFNTADITAHKGDNETAKNALDLINIDPNPYYAYSAYEKTALENVVKITNLPEECTVSIFTLNGTLIRKFNKSDPKTSLDWDLKNQAKIPVASGMYIIHVDVPNVGEKILKWFGVLRPIDLDSY